MDVSLSDGGMNKQSNNLSIATLLEYLEIPAYPVGKIIHKPKPAKNNSHQQTQNDATEKTCNVLFSFANCFRSFRR